MHPVPIQVALFVMSLFPVYPERRWRANIDTFPWLYSRGSPPACESTFLLEQPYAAKMYRLKFSMGWIRGRHHLFSRGRMGKKLPTIREGLRGLLAGGLALLHGASLHMMGISTNGEGKATSDFWFRCLRIASSQRTACENSLLRAVEGDGAKLLPVADE